MLRDFVWSKPAEEHLPNKVTESQSTFKAAKELEILKELKNLKRKKASGLDNFPPGLQRLRIAEADNGKATGAVFIDLSKAFDTISHSVLLSKLSRYRPYAKMAAFILFFCSYLN